jgi:glycogen operon protein
MRPLSAILALVAALVASPVAAQTWTGAGTDDNWSRNWGVEGPTAAVEILRMRERTQRNLLATLAFSQGVPMLLAGDEMQRTQLGNNNAYCQDNPLTWVDWELDEPARELLAFTRQVFALRAANPVLRRRGFFHGRELSGTGHKDVAWLRADGHELTELDWHDPHLFTLGMLIHGQATDEKDDRGRPVVDLNELEFVRGSVLANVWHTDRIAVIDPATGNVTAWIDLTGLRPAASRQDAEAVLNGIAYDEARDRLFVTGKKWPALYEIAVRPPLAAARGTAGR